MQVLKEHRAILESLILVTIEGYLKDLDWDFKNSITSPYFGAVHWHRGKERDAGSFLDIAAQKELFALYSGKVRNYPGDVQLPGMPAQSCFMLGGGFYGSACAQWTY